VDHGAPPRSEQEQLPRAVGSAARTAREVVPEGASAAWLPWRCLSWAQGSRRHCPRPLSFRQVPRGFLRAQTRDRCEVPLCY
jgi:hypothetical protein